VQRSCTLAPLQMMLFWMWLPSPMLMLSMSTQLITFTLLPSLQQQQQQWHLLPGRTWLIRTCTAGQTATNSKACR
jgi:hypothetical protein